MLDNDSENRHSRAQVDPPTSAFDKALLASLREVFAPPYQVVKVRDGAPNETGLAWSPDYWVEKNGRKILVVSVVPPETSPADLDGQMQKAFAVMGSNWFYRDKIAISAHHSVLIIPTEVSKELSEDEYLKYHYMFENVNCEIVRQPNLLELELYRDDEDREHRPIKWAQRKA